jgi:hypothetical protein
VLAKKYYTAERKIKKIMVAHFGDEEYRRLAATHRYTFGRETRALDKQNMIADWCAGLSFDAIATKYKVAKRTIKKVCCNELTPDEYEINKAMRSANMRLGRPPSAEISAVIKERLYENPTDKLKDNQYAKIYRALWNGQISTRQLLDAVKACPFDVVPITWHRRKLMELAAQKLGANPVQ